MLCFIIFLEACGELDEPPHPHPPNREFWLHPFNAEHEPSKVFETFYKKIVRNLKRFFAYYRMSSWNPNCENNHSQFLAILRFPLERIH